MELRDPAVVPADDLLAEPSVANARRILVETDERTLTDQAELTAIPAPPFAEDTRAHALHQRFADAGLVDVTIDEIGNVIARLPDAPPQEQTATDGKPAHDDGDTAKERRAAPVLLAAHLDTVFPKDTDVTVSREDDRILAPGIVDNGRGLTALLALARALRGARISTRRPLVFIGTVGEEGAGDLRGVKHLFRNGSPWREAAAFLAIDGTGKSRIVHRAIGSRRLRVHVHGPGGHSWANWGTANPIHAIGAAVADFARYSPPAESRSSLSVGRIGGGTSVNAIPDEAWFELDIRSEDADRLHDLERRVRETLDRAITSSNRQRLSGTEPLKLRIEVFGDRPSGTTPADSPIVTAASEATQRIGETPELIASSTDANVPIALGIPAITLGAGGEGGGMHTTEEWYRNEGGTEGLERVLLTALALAGIA